VGHFRVVRYCGVVFHQSPVLSGCCNVARMARNSLRQMGTISRS
jgi:hypothetical protein